MSEPSPETPRFAVPPIGVWTGSLDVLPARQAQEQAAELEALGYGVVWLPEVAGRDPFVHLALLLSATTTLIGATGIANIYGRDAVSMAEAVKALTEAFPERVLAGLGVSHQHLVEGLRGHVYDKPLSAMREYLDKMDSAPYIAHRPTTPVRRVIAALRPKMLALAAEKADGAHPYFVPPEHTARARELLGPEPLLCPEQTVLLESDPGKARELGRAFCRIYLNAPNYVNNLRTLGFEDEDLSAADGGSDRLVDAIVAWGSVDDILKRVQAHFDAGADHVCIQALPDSPRGVPVDQWRELAAPLKELAAGRA